MCFKQAFNGNLKPSGGKEVKLCFFSTYWQRFLFLFLKADFHGLLSF
ncbi:hypothetical protein [Ornithinibacillus sp. 179-J 7C1 HS]